MGRGAEEVRVENAATIVYIPPFTMHQHFANAGEECRIIVMSNRIVKDMGFDWYDQVETRAGILI